jgi:hypothetical protein
MYTYGFLDFVFLGTVFSVLAGCSSQTEQPPATVQREKASEAVPQTRRIMKRIYDY